VTQLVAHHIAGQSPWLFESSGSETLIYTTITLVSNHSPHLFSVKKLSSM